MTIHDNKHNYIQVHSEDMALFLTQKGRRFFENMPEQHSMKSIKSNNTQESPK